MYKNNSYFKYTFKIAHIFDWRFKQNIIYIDHK